MSQGARDGGVTTGCTVCHKEPGAYSGEVEHLFRFKLNTAFWFSSIASHAKKDTLTKAKDEFTKEREKLRVNAERQKTRLIHKSHEEIRRETNRVYADTLGSTR